jgi:catechol-2,3-dioxygenase
VVAAWTGLQERAGARKAALLSSNDYHTFMGIVRDLVAWSSSLRRNRRQLVGCAYLFMIFSTIENMTGSPSYLFIDELIFKISMIYILFLIY